MSTSTRVIKNTFYLYIRMGVSMFVSVYTTRILLQALGASDFGLCNVVSGTLAMLGFLSTSLSSTTQRFISYAEGEGLMEKTKEIFDTSLILHGMMSLVVMLLFTLCGFIFFNGVLNIPEGRELTAVLIYGCMTVSTVVSIVVVPYYAVLTAHENMLYYSVLGIIEVLLKLAVAVIISYAEWDRLLFYGILMAAESFFVTYLTLHYCVNHYAECRNVNLRRIPDKTLMKRMTSFAGWNVLHISSGMTTLYGMNIVINHFFGTLLNAAMGIATQLAGAMQGISANMTKSLAPVLVKSEGAKEREQMLSITMLGCKYSYLLYSMFCIPVMFHVPLLLGIWLHEVPEWTVLFTRLMIVCCLTNQLFEFLYQTIQAQGTIRNYNIVRSVVNILPLPVSIWQFTCGWEPFWITVDWIFFYMFIGGLINLYYASRNAGLSLSKWLKKVLLPCMLITIISCSLGYIMELVGYHGRKEEIISFFVFFFACLPLYWFIGVSRSEREIVLKRIKCKKYA